MEKFTIDTGAEQVLQNWQGPVEHVWQRYQEQEPQCGFGSLGLCCRHCGQGPCRINPFGKPDKGICGADGNIMVARNLLRQVTAGAAAHVDHAYETLEVLEKALSEEGPYKITDAEKLKGLAHKLGIAVEGKDIKDIGKELVAKAREDFQRFGSGELNWLVAHAPKERVAKWRELGVIPRNADREIREALHQTTMGMDASWPNLLLATVKLGLVDGYAGLKLGTDLQDILFGTPQPVFSEANLGVLTEENVNIVMHGHIPLLSEKIVEWARKLTPEAQKAGAKSIQVSGICCTANEILMRHGIPLATNFLAQELAIATGLTDAMIVDVQCIMPSLASLARCYHTVLITTNPIVKMDGATHLEWSYQQADEMARKAVELAIAAYSKRDPAKINATREKTTLMVGFSVETIISILSKIDAQEPLKPLVQEISNGDIQGVVATVGCNNVKITHDYLHVNLVKELISKDVLVVTTGCSANALAKAGLLNSEATEKWAGPGLKKILSLLGQVAGLDKPLPPVWHMGSCVDNSRIGDVLTALAEYLGVTVQQLPVAASAPEHQHEKALAIGTWAVAMGCLVHLGVMPPILGGQEVTAFLTSGAEEVLGGKFFVESDPVKAATVIYEHIQAKRKGLGL
ncbi:Ni-dependent carbon monoxide dehydrogenase precursor [Carboxydocella sporoproducens DSM 16521]|uniref:Carbon monoxide dehydrogenase n=2 Tax=Carboxydocella TaxID=178898 RepID=A0A1T4RJF9_9FIRM|nr:MULTISPECIES: anaerobic carbon-monoxide dehydrogenase catalytic subunit [Carboxydocella]AVX20792.1 Ni-dependent carbon monoxide dehydrogenase CooS [Carboxydocella thermautotrophica]SKA15878.1 Ni-dependent carbon monoxide dehydrogenase precursor [Carboxydocella sporoproducens DSM 16521]